MSLRARVFAASVYACGVVTVTIVSGLATSGRALAQPVASDEVMIATSAGSSIDAPVTSGDIVVGDDVIDGAPASIKGAVEVDTSEGTATIDFDIRRVTLIPIAFGSIVVDSPGESSTLRGIVLGPLVADDAAREVRGRAVAIRWTGFVPGLVRIDFAIRDLHADAGDRVENFVHSGARRRAIVHLPTGYDPAVPRPVLFNLHGYLEQDWMVDLFGSTSGFADANGYIAVYPKSAGVRWSPNDPNVDDLGYFDTLVETLVDEYGADPARLYVTGFSNGGRFTNVLGCERSSVFAAFVPMHGFIGDGDSAVFSPLDCSPARPIPITLIAGTDDPLVPYSALEADLDLWLAKNACDPESETITDLADSAAADGTTVRRHDWTCPPGAPVVHFEIVNGGHNWPGGEPFLPPPLLGNQTYDIDANEIVWDFVSGFTLT